MRYDSTVEAGHLKIPLLDCVIYFSTLLIKTELLL